MRSWAAPLAIVVLAAIVRWAPGGDLSLGVDDGVSLLTAARPLAEIVPSMLGSHEVHPPLYFYYLHPWVASVDSGSFSNGGLEAHFHLSSLPWALLAVLLTWRLGLAIGGPRVAVAAGLLTALSNYLGYYALEVRMYGMLTVLVLGAAWAAWEGARIPLAACCLLAFFTHYEAVFFIAALGLFCALDGQGRRWIVPALVIAAGLAAWTPTVLSQAAGQAFTLREAPSWPQAVELAFELGFGVTWPAPLPGWQPAFPLVKLLGLAFALAVAGAMWRAEPRTRRFLACLVALPLLAVFTVSALTSVRVFEYKYFQPLAPFVYLGLAMWARPGEKPWGPAVVAAVIAVNCAAWVGFLRAPDWYGPQDWRQIVHARDVAPGDLVVVHPSMMAAPVYVYAVLEKLPLRIVPADSADAPQLLEALAGASRAWLWTTPAHPFVAQQQLLRQLPPPWQAALVRETDSYWPANRIQSWRLQR